MALYIPVETDILYSISVSLKRRTSLTKVSFFPPLSVKQFSISVSIYSFQFHRSVQSAIPGFSPEIVLFFILDIGISIGKQSEKKYFLLCRENRKEYGIRRTTSWNIYLVGVFGELLSNVYCVIFCIVQQFVGKEPYFK